MEVKVKDIVVTINFVISIIGLVYGWIEHTVTIKGLIIIFSLIFSLFKLTVWIYDNWKRTIIKF